MGTSLYEDGIISLQTLQCLLHNDTFKAFVLFDRLISSVQSVSVGYV